MPPKVPKVPDRPTDLHPGDVWVDYETREIVLVVSPTTEMRFNREEADKFFVRFQGHRLCLHDHIRLSADLQAHRELEDDPFAAAGKARKR